MTLKSKFEYLTTWGFKLKIIPTIHFLLSFLYERLVIEFEQSSGIVQSIPKNNVISDAGERILGYLIAKLFALAMIFFLWNLFFYVVEHWKEKKNLKFFVGFLIVGLAVVLCLWPEPFRGSLDNLITYSYAIRLWPEYWHSAYTSCIYTAAMMVVPHPIFISVFQWIFGVFVLGYLYNRIVDSPVLLGKGKYVIFLVFLMPGAYILFTDSYRTEIYALLCMFLVSMTAMDLVDHKKRGIPSLIFNILVCGFIGVWRTEGIILGVLLFLLQLIFIYQYRPVKSMLLFLCVILSFMMFSAPQKLGDKKYYGKDYSFINSFPTLRNILSSDKANLNYEGAEEDLMALEAVTPVEILRYYGMDGYRRYNFSQGRYDINQSLASDEVSAAYMKSYYNIVAHNIPIYLKTQLFMLMKALMIVPDEYVCYCNIYPENDLQPWTLVAWDIGREDMNRIPGFEGWVESSFHVNVSSGIKAAVDSIANALQKIKFYTIVLIVIPLFEIYLFFREAILFLKKKENQIGLAGIAFILLGQAAAILLVMPAGTLVYLHAYYYCSLILCMVYINYCRVRKNNVGNP